MNLQPGTRVRVANSERFATVIEHGATPRYATIEYEDGTQSMCPVSKLAVESLPLYGEPGFSEGAEQQAKLAAAFTHVAGTIGPFDPPGVKGQIRKGVISAVNAPATTFEAHKDHAEVVADRVICLAVIYDMVKELEQWRAAFGGTFEEVSERFLRGVDDDDTD